MIRNEWFDSCCLACGMKYDAVSQCYGDEAMPEDGDVAVCIKCRHIGVYDKNGNIVPGRNLDEKLRIRTTAQAYMAAHQSLYERGVEAVTWKMIVDEVPKFMPAE